jgi:hypothetical protein
VWLFTLLDVVGLILLVVGVILAIYAAATTRTGV